MDQISTGIRSILINPTIFRFLDWLLGGYRIRQAFVDHYVQPKSQHKILEIGCGIASLLEHLPTDIHYTGYDLQPEYIEFAKKRYGARAEFHCKRVSEMSSPPSNHFDTVIAYGLLHHLSNTEAEQLFQIAFSVLKPGGRLVTLDNVYTPNQSKIARYVISKDRGQHVRTPEGYQKIVLQSFSSIETEIKDKIIRIPYTYFLMKCYKAPTD